MVQAVIVWPIPETQKHLQRFLRFANFYRCFIRDKEATHLTRLTSPTVPFTWSSDSDKSILKNPNSVLYCSVLIHPDPSLQFVVEADASNTGVGAILSQRSPDYRKIHLCAFFSH